MSQPASALTVSGLNLSADLILNLRAGTPVADARRALEDAQTALDLACINSYFPGQTLEVRPADEGWESEFFVDGVYLGESVQDPEPGTVLEYLDCDEGRALLYGMGWYGQQERVVEVITEGLAALYRFHQQSGADKFMMEVPPNSGMYSQAASRYLDKALPAGARIAFVGGGFSDDDAGKMRREFEGIDLGPAQGDTSAAALRTFIEAQASAVLGALNLQGRNDLAVAHAANQLARAFTAFGALKLALVGPGQSFSYTVGRRPDVSAGPTMG